MTSPNLYGDWDRARRIFGSFSTRFEAFERRILAKIGMLAVKEVRRNIDARGSNYPPAFAPNAPSTIRRKRSSKPLVDHGDLRGSITYKVLNGMVFVGVLKTARNRDGDDLSNIAQWLHDGWTMQTNAGMLVVQGRPFLLNVAQSDRFRGQVEDLVRRELEGLFR